jgi:hypothetical protein
MGDAARAWFGINPWGVQVVNTTTTNAIMSIFGCMHIIDYVVEYIHIFDTLLINYVSQFPPCLPLGGGYQPVHQNWERNQQSTRLLVALWRLRKRERNELAIN